MLVHLEITDVSVNMVKQVNSLFQCEECKLFYKEKSVEIEKTLGERKSTMLLKGDAVVALVGGIGTLDELTEIIELRKQGHHKKPIVILNTENFYEGLKVQLQKMKDDGFIPNRLDKLVYFANTPEEAINYINTALGS